MLPDDDRRDVAEQVLSRLGTFDMDLAQVEHVRARCHRALDRRGRWQRLAVFAETPFYRGVLEPTLLAAVSGVYLFEVVSRALGLLGL